MAKKRSKKKTAKKRSKRGASKNNAVKRTRRSFTSEQRESIVREVDEAPRGSAAGVCEKHGVGQSLVSLWRKNLRADPNSDYAGKTKKKGARAEAKRSAKAASPQRAGRRASDQKLLAENQRLKDLITRLMTEGKITIDDLLS